MAKKLTKAPTATVSPMKLRLLADALERDALRHVAELRRLADLMDGVGRLTRAPVTAVKKRKPAKATKRAAKKVAKKAARKVTRRAAKKVTRRAPSR